MAGERLSRKRSPLKTPAGSAGSSATSQTGRRRPPAGRRHSCLRLRRAGLGDYRTVFQYSDTWQLVINTGTTIVTFLMVFLIQNSQNRDSAAIQVKLDELIRVGAARIPLSASSILPMTNSKISVQSARRAPRPRRLVRKP